VVDSKTYKERLFLIRLDLRTLAAHILGYKLVHFLLLCARAPFLKYNIILSADKCHLLLQWILVRKRLQMGFPAWCLLSTKLRAR
jgi:hypothetical protein